MFRAFSNVEIRAERNSGRKKKEERSNQTPEGYGGKWAVGTNFPNTLSKEEKNDADILHINHWF